MSLETEYLLCLTWGSRGGLVFGRRHRIFPIESLEEESRWILTTHSWILCDTEARDHTTRVVLHTWTVATPAPSGAANNGPPPRPNTGLLDQIHRHCKTKIVRIYVMYVCVCVCIGEGCWPVAHRFTVRMVWEDFSQCARLHFLFSSSQFIFFVYGFLLFGNHGLDLSAFVQDTERLKCLKLKPLKFVTVLLMVFHSVFVMFI